MVITFLYISINYPCVLVFCITRIGVMEFLDALPKQFYANCELIWDDLGLLALVSPVIDVTKAKAHVRATGRSEAGKNCCFFFLNNAWNGILSKNSIWLYFRVVNCTDFSAKYG